VSPPVCCDEPDPASDEPHDPANTAASPESPNAEAHRQTTLIFMR
jgi:hypothetical protein